MWNYYTTAYYTLVICLNGMSFYERKLSQESHTAHISQKANCVWCLDLQNASWFTTYLTTCFTK